MALFRFDRKKDILDLTKYLRKKQEKISQMQLDAQKTSSQSSSQHALSFLDNLASGSSQESGDYVDISTNAEEKRKKFSKRLLDMTNKIEELSNQLYHLQQRVEVLERKLDVNSF